MTSFETALLYHAHHARNLEDLAFWLRQAGRQAGPLLELGCGTGRVLLPLAQAGHRVYGVDLDAGMLAVLRHYWPAQAASQPGPPVFQADFTCLHLAAQFGLALLPCNTYTTLDAAARRALLGGVRAHLLPQGVFIVSLPNVRVLSRLPPRSAARIEEVFPHPLDGQPVQVSSAWQRLHRVFRLTWLYDHALPQGDARRTTVMVAHYLDPLEQYLDEMETAGFRRLEMYGDYDESSFHDQAPYVLLVLQKSA